MIYNAHATYENAIPYATDLTSRETQDMSSILSRDRTKFTSSYVNHRFELEFVPVFIKLY